MKLNLHELYLTALWNLSLQGFHPENCKASARAQITSEIQAANFTPTDQPSTVHFDVHWDYSHVDEYSRPAGTHITLYLPGQHAQSFPLPAGQEKHYRMLMMGAQIRQQNVHVHMRGGAIVEMWVDQ